MNTYNEQTLLASVTAAVGSHALDISVKNGAVTLKGEVADDAQAKAIVKTVENIPGVTSVKDDLKIRRKESGSLAAFVEDSAITAEVKAKILAQKGLDSLDISVETVKGEVTLTGAVENRTQVSLAESTALQSHGVKRVENRLTVKK